jgi:hypothetical protein
VRTPSPTPSPAPVAATTAPAAPAAPAVTFGCKILETNGTTDGEEFDVTTSDGSTYNGSVTVSFYDYAGSGDTFPSTTVDGAGPTANWQPVPPGDIGASAAPTGCIASAG